MARIVKRRSRRLRGALVAAGAVLAMTAALCLLRGGETAPARLDSGASLKYSTGQLGTYRLRTTSDVELSADQRVRQSMTATLQLCVLEVAADTAELGMRLVELEFTVDGDRDSARESAMATPFIARVDGGIVRDMRFPDGLADTTRRQLDAIVRAFQCTLQIGSEHWHAIEEDGIGRYRAEYERGPTGTLSRRKTAYLSGQAPGGVPCSVRILHSAASLLPAEDGPWLRRADLDERLELSSAGVLAATIHQTTTLELLSGRRIGLAPSAQQWLAGAEHQVAMSRTLDSMAPAPSQRAPTATEERSFLATLARYASSDGADMAAIHALARALREMPELAAGLELELRSAGTGSRVAAGLCHALELAGNERGQESLVRVGLDGTLRPTLRFCALAALGGVPEPSAATQTALLRATADADPSLASAAQLALGSMGNALRKHDPQRYGAVREFLADRIANSVDTDAAVVALRAASNTKDAQLASIASTRLHDAEAPIRAAAADTAGALGGAPIAELLDRALRAEPDPRVRVALVRGLHATGELGLACETCADLVTTESDETARGAMARLLADHVGERPELRPVLESVLERESSASIAAYVAGRLHRSAR